MNLDEKKANIEKLAKIGAVAIVGFFVAPVIFVTIKGIIGLAVAGAVSLVAINLTPWFAAKVGNWRLKALKHEAALNPIETLQNEYQARQAALERFFAMLKVFISEFNSFKEKLVDLKRKYPAEAARFDEQQQKMKEVLSIKQQKYSDAKQSLATFDDEIKRATALWEMAQAAARMNKAAGVVDGDEFVAKLQRETALDAVQKSMGVAFADLEMSLLDEKLTQLNTNKTQAVHASQLSTALPE